MLSRKMMCAVVPPRPAKRMEKTWDNTNWSNQVVMCFVKSILDTFLQEHDHCELFTGMRPETPNTIVRNNKGVKWRSGKVLGVSASNRRVDVAVTITARRMYTRVLGCLSWQSLGEILVNFRLLWWPTICITPVYHPEAELLKFNYLPTMLYISIRRDVN